MPAASPPGPVGSRLGGQACAGCPGPSAAGSRPEVVLIGGKACLQRVRPADLLKPGWDPLVIQIRMITAVAADDLEQAGAVAFAVMHDPGRLPPQAGCPAMAGLASKREWHGPLGVDAEPRARRITQPTRCGDGTQTRSRSGTRRDIRLFGATHFNPRASSLCHCRGLEQHYRRAP